MDMEIRGAIEGFTSTPTSILVSADEGMLPQSQGSNIIFVSPPGGGIVFKKMTCFIPTPYLRDIFESQLCKVANQECLQLFCALSSHALTRSAAGWAHEKLMHQCLGAKGAPLDIFQGNQRSTMQRSTNIIPGTLGALKQIQALDSFYWMPSGVNFEGIDSVLGTSDGQVYTIQATIAATHNDPIEGIKTVWRSFDAGVRTQRTWHFVVVTETKALANMYVDRFLTEFNKFKLGNKSVQVWGCVLVN
jgi:hypothetical protein